MLWVLLGIPGFFLAYVLLFAVPSWRRAKASQSWPSTDGHVVYSQVGIARGFRGTFSAPDVRYQYQVEGHEYEGSMVRFTYSWSNAGVSRAVATYRIGHHVTVYYNATHPRESVLEVGIDMQDVRRALFPVMPLTSAVHESTYNR